MVGAYAEKWMSARLAVDGMKPAEVYESQAGDYPSLPSSVIKKVPNKPVRATLTQPPLIRYAP
jgi:hypothetical protein